MFIYIAKNTLKISYKDIYKYFCDMYLFILII